MGRESSQPEQKRTDPTPAKGRRPTKERRSIAVPLITGLGLVLAFCAYYFVYVPERREYLINRNFRALAVLGNQLERSVNIHATVLQMFVDQKNQVSPRGHQRRRETLDKFLRVLGHEQGQQESHEDRMQYLRFLAPNFELIDMKDSGDHPAFDVNRRRGAWNIELATPGSGPAANNSDHNTYVGAIKLTDLLQPFVESLPFDDVLLASQSGVIVYEKSLSGPQFTTLGALLGNQAVSGQLSKQSGEAQGSGETASKPDDAESSSQVQLNSDTAWRSKSLHLTEISLAATKYTVFLQPVLLDYGVGTQPHKEKSGQWVLCGLTKSKGLDWEALSISYTIIIWLVAAFLLVCLGAPIAKLFLLNQWEHLKASELGFIACCFILLSSVCTFSSLQAIYYHLIADRTDDNLNHIATNLASNVRTEMRQMRLQLVHACHTAEVARDLQSADQEEVIRQLSKDIQQVPEKELFHYPYFDNLFWTDSDGHQIVKWSSSAFLTPMIDISDLPAYKHLSDPEQHSLMYLDGIGPPFVFDSVVPLNKLDYLAAMGVSTCSCNPDLCNVPDKIRPDEANGYAFIVARPFSLLQPLLPYGYGFALVDRSGSVLFHTDRTRNTVENLLQESDSDPQLYAAMFGHANGNAITINYMGKPYRARVVPINGLAHAAWSLVVFRDLTFVRTLNLQTTTMSSSCFLVMLALPIAVALIWRSTCGATFIAEWLWPHKGRVRTYVYLASLYAICSATLVLIASVGGSEDILLACFGIPYSALAFTCWAVWFFPSGTAEARRLTPPQFLAGVILSAGGLGVVLSILVCDWPYLNALWMLLPMWLLAALPLFSKPQNKIAGALLTYFGSEATEDKANSLRFDQSYRTLYVLCALLLLLLLGVLVPLTLFLNLRRVEGRLYMKESQLHLASSAERQQALLRSQCDLQQRSLPECEEVDRGEKSSWQQSHPDPAKGRFWSRYSLIPLNEHTHGPDLQPHYKNVSREFYTPWFEHLIYALHHDYNGPAAEMMGVIGDRGGPKVPGARQVSTPPDVPEWTWTETDTNLTLRKHGSEPTGPGPASDPTVRNDRDMVLQNGVRRYTGRDIAIAIGVAGFVLAITGGVFWAAASRIFLFHVRPHRIKGRRQVSEALQSGNDIVLLLPPKVTWNFDVDTSFLCLDEIATGPQWAQEFDLAAMPTKKLIEIWYSDPKQSDPPSPGRELTLEERERQARADNQKMLFLHRLHECPATQVAVIIVIGASRQEFTKIFPTFEVVDLREHPRLWEEAYSGPAGASLWRECAPLPVLWPLGAQLAMDFTKDEELQPGRTYSASSVAADVLERAEPYYKMIWNECSSLQKFVLSQLAADGAANPENDRIIQQFVRRGLIVKDPQFRIMNESFRRFLVAAPTPRLKHLWLRESHKTGWGKAHGSLFIMMLVVGAFLLTTQNDLWQSSAAYVTTALGALGTLAKLLTSVRTGGMPATDKDSEA